MKERPSNVWDAMCILASRNNHPTSSRGMRTADPRLNPKAVACSETSTTFRKRHERWSDAAAH